MNKKIRTLALLPIFSLLLTACTLQDLPVIGKYFGDSGGVGTDPVTLKMWGLWEDPEVINGLISKYQEQYPNVTIEYEDRSIMTLPEYKERVFSRFQDPADSAQIDIAIVHNSWVSRLSSLLAPMPSSLMDVPTYESRFYPVITASGVVNNNILATPAYYDGLVLVYNRAHFEEVNQTLPPTAWEEFRRLALELTIRGDQGSIVRAGAAMGSANNIDNFSDIISLMWSQADVGVSSDMVGKTHFGTLEQYNALVNELDTSPAYDAVAFYTNFLLEDRVWSETLPEASTAFANGQVSMIFVPTWKLLDIYEASPDIASIGVAPVPQAIQDDPRSWASFWMYTVPTNSSKQAVAWDFLNFLSQDEQQLMYFNEVSQLRPFGTPFPQVSLREEVNRPELLPVLNTAPYARSSEFSSRSGNITQVDGLRAAVNDVLKGTAPEDALRDLKEDLQN